MGRAPEPGADVTAAGGGQPLPDNPWEKWGWTFAAIWLVFLAFPVIAVAESDVGVPAKVLALLCIGWRARRLGDMKWFVKNVVKFVPGPGVGMWLLDCIFLARDWLKDRKNIDTLFKKYKEEQIPLFLVSFLEGTRLTPKKLAAAQAFAKERGHYVPKHTLVPRTKGFGNARVARNLFEASVNRHASRVVGLTEHTDADLTSLTADDVPDAISGVPAIDEAAR